MVNIDEIPSPGGSVASNVSGGNASSASSVVSADSTNSRSSKKKNGGVGPGSSASSVSSVTTATSAASAGISAELMKVAVAGWEKSEQGPTAGTGPDADGLDKELGTPVSGSNPANALDPQVNTTVVREKYGLIEPKGA